eukprot:2473845-Pleurochrysis_carterae.AAC.3
MHVFLNSCVWTSAGCELDVAPPLPSGHGALDGNDSLHGEGVSSGRGGCGSGGFGGSNGGGGNGGDEGHGGVNNACTGTNGAYGGVGGACNDANDGSDSGRDGSRQLLGVMAGSEGAMSTHASQADEREQESLKGEA